MKYAVNWYQDSLKPEPRQLQLHELLIAVVVIALIMTASVWFAPETGSERLQQLQSENQGFERQLRELNTELSGQNLDQQAAERMSELTVQLQQQQELLQYLERLEQQQRLNYAQLFKDLASVARDDLWLTRIQVDAGELTLHGHTLRAQALPEWLQGLQETASLKAAEFELVDIQEPAQTESQARRLQFKVATEINR